MLDSNQWFTEIDATDGSAFSMQIHARVHEEKTPYQTIEIYETAKFGYLMVIDGCTMLTTRETFLYHEMMTHPALFTHANPKRVCIIGGGDCGTLTEVLKHDSIESVVQIDIDERVTRLAEQYFPELTASNQDPRAQLLFEDGVRWIQEREADSLDLILVDSTDPVGPAEGLFSRDFFADCLRVLAPGGILVQQSESPLYHLELLKKMHREMRAAGFSSSRTLFFPQLIYPSSWWSATMAGKGIDLTNFRREDAQARSFATRYYNADIHQAAFAQPEFFRVALSEALS